jgi:hypothetical protein
MSTPVVPSKTALGQDELRHRTHRLSQRHRTVLLLVDGRRSLGEVLDLANQAGAAISHFEELVRLGLVDVPVEASPPAEPPPEPAASPDEPQLTSVELLVPAAPPEAPTDEIASTEPPEEAPIAAADVTPPAPPEPPRAAEPPPRIEAVAPPLLLDEVPAVDEEPVVERVRQHLLELLRLDGPMFGSRLVGRVRGAQSTAELIDLVWEIERQLGMTKRSRQGQLCLERARDLLGLGNTQVAEDTQPGHGD